MTMKQAAAILRAADDLGLELRILEGHAVGRGQLTTAIRGRRDEMLRAVKLASATVAMPGPGLVIVGEPSDSVAY